MSELVIDTLEGSVAVLRLNAPERINALSLDMREALLAKLQQRFMDDECKAIVLAGAGGNFCAGGDVKSTRPAPAAIARTLRYKLSRLHELVRTMANGPKPVVAAVEGKALGAGLSLALACDVIVAADNARFGAVFGKVGLTPDAGLFYTLPQRVGGARAQQLMLSASLVDAERALAIGLADQVVLAAELTRAACEEASRLAEIAPLAFAAIKSLGNGGCGTLEEAFAQEMRLLPLLGLTQDYAEGRIAFAEKRRAVFRGI